MGTAQVQAGVAIAYRLRPSDRPTNPERLWHGIVEDVYPGACKVRLTEPGFEGLEEMIFLKQIVGIEGNQNRDCPPDDRDQPQEVSPPKRGIGSCRSGDNAANICLVVATSTSTKRKTPGRLNEQFPCFLNVLKKSHGMQHTKSSKSNLMLRIADGNRSQRAGSPKQ